MQQQINEGLKCLCGMKRDINVQHESIVESNLCKTIAWDDNAVSSVQIVNIELI